MALERIARLQFRLVTLLGAVAIALLAYLSHRHATSWDWTASGRNTLSQTSREVLARLKGPVEIVAFLGESKELRLPVRRLIDRYLRAGGEIRLRFVNPDLHPEEARRLGIQRPGEVVVRYGGRSERLEKLSEEALTGALLRLLKRGEFEVLFLEGHGERSPFGQANFDLGRFGRALQEEGYRIERWNPARGPFPEKAALLVVASPQVALLPAELEQLKALSERVDLLWLSDPGKPFGLKEVLGLSLLPGTLVEPESERLLGLSDPTFLVVTSYPDHPLLEGFDQITLFPGAAALKEEEGWQPLLLSSPSSWNETDLEAKVLTLDEERGERIGPHPFGLARESGGRRVVVVGDGDFLANAFIGNGGNLDLGLRMVRWLTHQDTLVEIPRQTPPDAKLELSSLEVTLIAALALLLPLLYLGIGALVWFRQR